MNILDKTLLAISPERAMKRAETRSKIEELDTKNELYGAQRQVLHNMLHNSEITNSGYSHGGASRRRTWAKKYHADSNSAKSDIEMNRKLLRERARDLCMNAPLATAAVGSTRTNVVGAGIVPKPKIDYEFLGISQDSAKELQKNIKKEFAIWAESTLCDNNDQNDFYELQQIAFSDWLKNGEEIVLIKYDKPLEYMPYQLRLKLVEADRLCTPGSLNGEYDGFDKEDKISGNRIMNGVEINNEGKVIAYYICSQFPGEEFVSKNKWERIIKRGEITGNPNILHIFNGERADQYRGVPFLAPVIESIKQLTRYTEAEIMAAVINSMFAIFIRTESGDDINDFGGEEDEDNPTDVEDEDDIKLGSGTVNFLKEGESVEAVESKHPSGNFDAFSSAMAKYIGAALEIAPEVLLKQFTNNFSASKGAMNETWKAFRMRRTWFVNDFCQQVYELWFSEAVSKGRISAPGYFNDPIIKKAYTRATWNGPAQGQLDPSKEVGAAIMRVKEGFSTREDECTSMNGSDFEDNIRTLVTENEMLRQAQDMLVEDKGGNE